MTNGGNREKKVRIKETLRRVLAALLAVLLAFSMIDFGAFSMTQAAEAENDTSGVPTADDSGVYQIGTAAELLWFAGLVNGDSSVCTGDVSQNAAASAKLTADIDLSDVCSATLATSWTPIGSEAAPYTGTFDGGGHTVSNLYINGSDNYQGLFGVVGGGVAISNVAVTGSVTGRAYIAGLVGGSNAYAKHCTG